MMTSDDLDRFVKMNAAIHRMVYEATSDLYKSLATRDIDAVRRASRHLREVTASSTALSAAINELAERL